MATEKHADSAGLISVDATIDDIAAKALAAARQKEADASKVQKPPTWPRTAPTPREKPRK